MEGQLKNSRIYSINFIDFCTYDHLEYSDVQCAFVVPSCILSVVHSHLLFSAL